MAPPLSPEANAVLAAIFDCENERIAIAQGFRALAFLESAEPLTREQLIRVADELDP